MVNFGLTFFEDTGHEAEAKSEDMSVEAEGRREDTKFGLEAEYSTRGQHHWQMYVHASMWSSSSSSDSNSNGGK